MSLIFFLSSCEGASKSLEFPKGQEYLRYSLWDPRITSEFMLIPGGTLDVNMGTDQVGKTTLWLEGWSFDSGDINFTSWPLGKGEGLEIEICYVVDDYYTKV